MYRLGTIREWKTENFHIIVDAVEETDLDLSWDETGETLRKLESGELIAFCARARVMFRGLKIASDYLGNCVYKDLEDFEDHRECAAYTRKLNRLHGRFNIYRKSRQYEHCLGKSDKLKSRGFATRERAERWAQQNAKEPYEIFGPSVCGSYFAGMVSEVIREARAYMQSIKSIQIRAKEKS